MGDDKTLKSADLLRRPGMLWRPVIFPNGSHPLRHLPSAQQFTLVMRPDRDMNPADARLNSQWCRPGPRTSVIGWSETTASRLTTC